jgi:hypothetical protein
MKLMALLLGATLMGHAAMAQQARPSPPAAPASLESDAKPAATGNLPVSLDKIREGLERITAPGLLIKGVEDTPTFRVEILEQRKVAELLSTLDFTSGAKLPGGAYAYEQQRILFPPADHPIAQPLVVISAEAAANLIGARYVAEAVKNAFRVSQQQASRAEVERAVAEYCAGKPNGGAGIEMCAPPPSSR